MFSITSLAQFQHITIDDSGRPNEPSVALSQSGTIYASSNVDNFYIIQPTDQEYQITKSKVKSKYGMYGDPVLLYQDSTLFFAHLSKTEGKEYGDWFDRIVVQKITNPNTWDEQSYSVGYNNGKMQDKPWMSADNHSTNKGNVYVTWTEFDKYDSEDPNDRSRIRFSKFTSQSDSFSEAITISDTTGNCLDGDETLEGATTAIGTNGEIYAVWAGYDKIYFDYSTDGGKSWHKDKIIASQPEGWDMDMPHIGRANGMPFLVCDSTRNVLYICWADEYDGKADVWMKYSKDGGQSWSERIRVNSNRVDKHCYFPNMKINQQTGKVYIAYYNQRHSSTHRFYDVYLSVFNISKNTSPQINRVTQQSIPLPGPHIFYGDYLDLSIANERIGIVYTTFYHQTVAVELAMAEINNLRSTSNETVSYSISHDYHLEEKLLQLWLNVQEEGRLKFKAKYGYGIFKSKIKVKQEIYSNRMDKDIHLASILDPAYIPISYKLKIKSKSGNVSSFRYKKDRKGIPGTPIF